MNNRLHASCNLTLAKYNKLPHKLLDDGIQALPRLPDSCCFLPVLVRDNLVRAFGQIVGIINIVAADAPWYPPPGSPSSWGTARGCDSPPTWTATPAGRPGC